jgi:hypothetical protein
MASKLNPGADATLVGVAYRAAMANTPADYSDTLERAADSYTKTMEASSEMWGNIAKVGAAIGSEMVKNAQELTDMVAKGATLNPEDAKMFYDEIYGLKDDFKELGTFGGMFGDRETRLKRAELKAKQQELFADIDNAVANLKVGADAIAAGTFDYELAGLENEETINAIIKSNLKNKFTNEGNMAKLSRNEKGELMYTLYKENGELADNPNGTKEPVTMTLKEFNESIATNVKDGGAMMKSFVDLREAEAKAGNGALNSTYDPERKQMTLNNLDLLLGDKPVNLKRAMRTPIGYSNTSFFDDITREQGEHSVGLYNTLLEVTGGNVLTGEITEGMVDIDGVEGISRQEAMNADNYKILTANIIGLKDPEASKAYFKEYAVKEMEAAYKYGYSKKPPVLGGGPDGDENKFGLNLKKNYYTIQTPEGASYIDGQTISNSVETFKSIQDKGSGIFTGYDKVPHKLKNGKWFTYDDETEDFTKEDNAQSIFTALGWDNNPQIMGYLSPRLDVNNDGTPDGPVSLDFLNKKYYDLIDKK